MSFFNDYKKDKFKDLYNKRKKEIKEIKLLTGYNYKQIRAIEKEDFIIWCKPRFGNSSLPTFCYLYIDGPEPVPKIDLDYIIANDNYKRHKEKKFLKKYLNM